MPRRGHAALGDIAAASLMTRVSSWTMPVRSLPMAETARCCFIGSEVDGMGRGSVPGLARRCERYRRLHLPRARSRP